MQDLIIPEKKVHNLTVRISDTMSKSLEDIAAKNGVNRSEVARAIIGKYLHESPEAVRK